MNIALTAFLYIAIAASAGALTFLAGQRSSGRTPKEVDDCHEQAALLEGVKKDLDNIYEDAHRAKTPEDATIEVARARDQLEDAIVGLRRGADLVV